MLCKSWLPPKRIMELCAEHSYPPALSFKLNNNLCLWGLLPHFPPLPLALSQPLQHPLLHALLLLPPLTLSLSLPCSHCAHSPSLPFPFSCFLHTLCMCLCHVVDRPSLWPLQYVCYMEKKTLWCAYWLGLGILSSVGLGTGLHTFLLYLVRRHFVWVFTLSRCSYSLVGACLWQSSNAMGDGGGAVTQLSKSCVDAAVKLLLLIKALIKHFWRLLLCICTRMCECARMGLRAYAFQGE